MLNCNKSFIALKQPEIGGKLQRKHLVLLIAIAALYTLAVFLTPIDHALLVKYHLSLTGVRILDVLIIAPLLIIWTAAFYGFSVFDNYAKLIRRDKDGAAFHDIARGVTILAIGLALASLLSAGIGYYAHYHLNAVKIQVMVNSYFTMLVTLTAFIFMYRGASRLCKLTRKRHHISGNLIFNIIYIIFASLYTYLFVAHLAAAKDVPLTTVSHAAYYAPTWLLIPSFLITYLIAWYLGSLTVYLLVFYTKHVGGTLYANALRYLSYGIVAVIAGSIIIQALTVFTGQLQTLSTSTLIILIYVLIAIISAGYIPIAIGAKKLAKIETV
jgi:hypothetical protein